MRPSGAVILLSGVIATTAVVPSYAADDSSELAEVVVVARKRQENVQDVPDSISVFTDQQIEDARIQDIQDFAALTPNFEIHQGQGPGVFQMSIRGISQANKGEAPVTMVVDGVTLPYSDTFTAPLFDVQQIEVLKGPQGALYGQNSIGGAIVITTKQPTNTFEGSAQASVGRGGETREVGVLSGPLIDDVLFFRVGAIYHDSPGLVDYAFIPGQTADYLNEKGARGELKAVFGDSLTAVLGVEWHRTAGDALPLVPTSESYGSGIPNVTTQQVDQNIILGVPSQNSPTLNNLQNESVSLKVDWRLPIATLTSVSAWENESESIFQDLDVSNIPFVRIQDEYTPIHAWLQELRLTSNTPGPFQWLVGLFAQQVHYELNDDTVQLNTNLLAPPPPNLSPTAANWVPFELDNLDQHLDAYAASAQVSYKFLERWELTLAGRYDYDPRDSTEQTFNGVEPELRATYKEFEPKASLSYAFDVWGAEQHAYLTYAKGFRPGGFNSNAASQVAVAFPAETTQDLEVGMKFVLFDHKATLDLAGFHNIYKNQQETLVAVNGAGEASSDIFTIDKTTINGGELTLQARPMQGIDVGASFGYTDATVTNFGNSLAGTGLNAASFDGKTVPLVSKYTLNVNFQQTVPLAAQVDGFYRIDFNRYGRLYWYPDNAYSQNPYNLVDLQVGARFANWSVDTYGRNIFGQRYNVLFFDNNFVRAPGGFNFAYRSLPSTYGVEAAYHFK
jgi:iron complex outermembrane recepter protein